jgi:hypothetical protein
MEPDHWHDSHASYSRGDLYEFRGGGSGVKEGEHGFEEDEGGDDVDLVMAGHLSRGRASYRTKVVEDSGVGDDEVEGGDVVGGFERGDCGGGGGVVFVVDFDDDEGCVGGFGEGLEALAGGGVAYAGYDGVVWAGEIGLQEAIADSCVSVS